MFFKNECNNVQKNVLFVYWKRRSNKMDRSLLKLQTKQVSLSFQRHTYIIYIYIHTYIHTYIHAQQVNNIRTIHEQHFQTHNRRMKSQHRSKKYENVYYDSKHWMPSPADSCLRTKSRLFFTPIVWGWLSPKTTRRFSKHAANKASALPYWPWLS